MGKAATTAALSAIGVWAGVRPGQTRLPAAGVPLMGWPPRFVLGTDGKLSVLAARSGHLIGGCWCDLARSSAAVVVVTNGFGSCNALFNDGACWRWARNIFKHGHHWRMRRLSNFTRGCGWPGLPVSARALVRALAFELGWVFRRTSYGALSQHFYSCAGPARVDRGWMVRVRVPCSTAMAACMACVRRIGSKCYPSAAGLFLTATRRDHIHRNRCRAEYSNTFEARTPTSP